jgi:Glycosyl hydrolases family 2, sugar binding domain
MIAGLVTLSLTGGLIGAGGALAQGPAYAATPPAPGAPYRDGQNTRYTLGGGWLYRADPGDSGIAQGLWRDSVATDGWSPVTVPSAWNAGDLSAASFQGSVGWYRRDFTLPASAFAPYVHSYDRFWVVRFESVNLRATVWLNGVKIGTHTGAFLPYELDLKGLRRGVNRLTVRVDDRRTATDLPPGPGGGWWNYGGILREVLLRSVSRPPGGAAARAAAVPDLRRDDQRARDTPKPHRTPAARAAARSLRRGTCRLHAGNAGRRRHHDAQRLHPDRAPAAVVSG